MRVTPRMIRKSEKQKKQLCRNGTKPSSFTEHQYGVIQRIRLLLALILVVVMAAFAVHGCQIPVHSSLFVQPKIPYSNLNVSLVEDLDTGEQTAERTSHSNASRGSMSPRSCSQEVNRKRNCKARAARAARNRAVM